MPNSQKIQAVAELEDKLGKSQAVFLADYAGLTVKEQVALRQLVIAAGGNIAVAKNSLLKIALEHKGLDAQALAAELTGPNLTLFAESDPVAPLKALVTFAKGNEKELPKVKAGVLGKNILSMEKIIQLSTLPGKTELMARLLGTLSNPARNMVEVLAAPMRSLVYALSAINTKKASA